MTPTANKTKAAANRGTARKPGRLDDATRMAKAMSHPLRARILDKLNQRVASPNELSQEFKESLGTVSYHVRALLDLDCVELVDTAPRRGAVEHYYRATRRAIVDDRAWSKLPPSAKRGFAVEWFKKAFGDVSRAIDEGTIDVRENTHLSMSEIHLDEEAWDELAEELKAVTLKAMQLQADTAGRRQKGTSEGEEIPVRVVMALYEGAPAKRRRGAKR